MVTVRLGAAAFELPAGSRGAALRRVRRLPAHLAVCPGEPHAEPGDRAGHGPALRLPASRAADRDDTPAAVAGPPAEADPGMGRRTVNRAPA